MRRLEKQQAIALRLQGKSYNEIRKILSIPSKGTLSYWFRDLVLPTEAKKRLEHNVLLAQERGLLQYNKDRTEAILQENKTAHTRAMEEIGDLSRRELLLIGAALYWGEGTKSEHSRKNIRVAIANSDPRLIALFMRFVREVLNVPDELIRAQIQVHPNLDIEEAKIFWSKVTKLPVDIFYITQQLSSASRLKRPKRSLPFGTVSIRINKRVLFYRIKGYIEGLCENC
ncbi:hypothetical protein HYW17_02485 [Candidatus Uhrbacteria bacterium]|nr:hypothetical protein [Candidatus Uhrbacteria bacterium]